MWFEIRYANSCLNLRFVKYFEKDEVIFFLHILNLCFSLKVVFYSYVCFEHFWSIKKVNLIILFTHFKGFFHLLQTNEFSILAKIFLQQRENSREILEWIFCVYICTSSHLFFLTTKVHKNLNNNSKWIYKL